MDTDPRVPTLITYTLLSPSHEPVVLSVAVVVTVTKVLGAAVIATVLPVPYTLADTQLQKLGHVKAKTCIAVDGVCA